MPVYLKGRTYSISVMLNGSRFRVSSGLRHKHLAEDRERAMQLAIAENPLITTDRLTEIAKGAVKAAQVLARRAELGPTFGEVAAKTYAAQWAGSKNAKGARSTLNVILKDIPHDTPLRKLDRVFLKNYAALLVERKQENSTVNRKMCALSSILKHAIDEMGVLEVMPRMPKRLKTRTRQAVLNEADFGTLMAEVMRHDRLDDEPGARKRGGRPRKRDAHNYVSLFEFLYEMGMRPGEALQLRWVDVDFDLEGGGAVYAKDDDRHGLSTKNGRARAVPLTAIARSILLAQRSVTKDRPFEFCNNDRAAKLWAAARKRLGISNMDIVCYVTRHSYATRVIEATGDLHLAKELLGHSSIKLTSDTYAHVSTKYLARGADALNQRNLAVTRTALSVKAVTE